MTHRLQLAWASGLTNAQSVTLVEASYLLDSSVADSVRIVVVVDDLKVSHGFAFGCSSEVDLRFGLASSLCVNGEVGGFTYLHTCTSQKETVIVYCDLDEDHDSHSTFCGRFEKKPVNLNWFQTLFLVV